MKSQGWVKRAYLSVPLALSSLVKWSPDSNTKPKEPHQFGGNGVSAAESGRSGKYLFVKVLRAYSQMLGRRGFVDTPNSGARAPEHRRLDGDHSGPRRRDEVAKGAAKKGPGTTPRALDDIARFPPKHSDGLPSVSLGGTDYSLDPHAYEQAKSRLREAVAEHYRCVGEIISLAIESSRGDGSRSIQSFGFLDCKHDADVRRVFIAASRS